MDRGARGALNIIVKEGFKSVDSGIGPVTTYENLYEFEPYDYSVRRLLPKPIHHDAFRGILLSLLSTGASYLDVES